MYEKYCFIEIYRCNTYTTWQTSQYIVYLYMYAIYIHTVYGTHSNGQKCLTIYI